MTSSASSRPAGQRPRGRPRLDIDPEAVADAVAELFAEGGVDNVTIGGTAEKLALSRATLYRTVPTKDDLLAILFERSTRELYEAAQTVVSTGHDARAHLEDLIRLHVEAAIRMRRYMSVFFGGAGLGADAYERWQDFSRRYEEIWRGVVTEAIEQQVLQDNDPTVTTRLVLGMCIWVSRWYRPGVDGADAIADSAIRLILPG